MSLSMMIAAAAVSQAQVRLLSFEPSFVFPPVGQEASILYSNLAPGFPFDEVIPSWNVEHGSNAFVRVELRGKRATGDTKWYVLGEWSLDHERSPRVSVKDQKDENGNVLTDTLRFASPTTAVDLRVTVRTLAEGQVPRLKLLTVSFADSKALQESLNERSPAWGKVIEVPQRAQGNYPNGGVLCSPTCVSMVLWHYANLLGRPELNRDVPEVEKGVWDYVYRGAGNWPFNAAYVGSFPGMRSYITRLAGIQDLERWIDAGFPVICSAPLDLLRGQQTTRESGHLVVLVGFTKDGDPIFNDPAKRDEVRRTYRRSDFERAWKTSGRTVYLVYPEGANVPKDPQGLWIGP